MEENVAVALPAGHATEQPRRARVMRRTPRLRLASCAAAEEYKAHDMVPDGMPPGSRA